MSRSLALARREVLLPGELLPDPQPGRHHVSAQTPAAPGCSSTCTGPPRSLHCSTAPLHDAHAQGIVLRVLKDPVRPTASVQLSDFMVWEAGAWQRAKGLRQAHLTLGDAREVPMPAPAAQVGKRQHLVVDLPVDVVMPHLMQRKGGRRRPRGAGPQGTPALAPPSLPPTRRAAAHPRQPCRPQRRSLREGPGHAEE